MSANHSPEPWSFERVELAAEVTDDLCIMAPSPSFREIAQISRCYQGDRVKEMEEANARRICAAVNACAGIPTETLELVPSFESAGVKTIREVETQRDELLAALSRIDLYLRNAGATLPAPAPEGTIESAMRHGLCIALALVVDVREKAEAKS